MYIRKADRKLFRELDEHLTLPKGFYKFVDKVAKKHNLAIKKGSGRYFCTCCHNFFENKNVRINDGVRCPHCKMKFQVKSGNLRNFTFSDCVGILDKYKEHFVIRYFEVYSVYNGLKFNYDLCEYGRKIFNDYFKEEHEIINNHIFSGIGTCCIRHDGYLYDNNWHYFYSYWKGIGDALTFYPGNIKRVLKGTRYQYSHIWILTKHVEYLDLRSILHLYDESIEFLIKLKLYNLVGYQIRGKNFKERFGVDKEFLPFMQRHNITMDELEILKYYQKKKIKMIRYFSGMNINEIIRYHIDLDLLLKKTDYMKSLNSEYCDYLRFADQLRYDMKDKRILYPKRILIAHDRLYGLIEINKNQKYVKKIAKRFKELKKNVYKNNEFIIFPASSIESLIDESRMQDNCVKTYAERYANSQCDIYFMRLLDMPNHSLVTVEVKNNKVVQQRTKNNCDTTDEQKRFLKKWEKKVLNA